MLIITGKLQPAEVHSYAKQNPWLYLFNAGLCLRWATNCIKRCPTVSKGTGVCSCSCSRWQCSKVGWKAWWDEKRERKGRPLKIVKTGIKAQKLFKHNLPQRKSWCCACLYTWKVLCGRKGKKASHWLTSLCEVGVIVGFRKSKRT